MQDVPLVEAPGSTKKLRIAYPPLIDFRITNPEERDSYSGQAFLGKKDEMLVPAECSMRGTSETRAGGGGGRGVYM